MLFAGLTKQLADLFKVRAGEERTVSLVLAMTFLVAAGGTVGGNAIEALFFSRQGTSALPALYMALGVSNFIASLAITAVLGRVARVRVYLALPLVLATSLALQRVVLAFFVARTLLSRHVVAPTRAGASLIQDMQAGYRYVRSSPLWRAVSAATVLFAVLYFSLTFPFAKAATRAYPSAEQLAGFFGLFG